MNLYEFQSPAILQLNEHFSIFEFFSNFRAKYEFRFHAAEHEQWPQTESHQSFELSLRRSKERYIFKIYIFHLFADINVDTLNIEFFISHGQPYI